MYVCAASDANKNTKHHSSWWRNFKLFDTVKKWSRDTDEGRGCRDNIEEQEPRKD